MAAVNGPSARETKRLQTRERLMGAAVAEFKRAGMAEADVAAIVAAAGVAHGTFFFHFPTKEHVLLELENREEDRMAKQFGRFLAKNHDLEAALTEAVRLVLSLERRLGVLLFKDFLALHFSQTRPTSEDGGDHSLVVLLADRIEQARVLGELDPEVNPMNSAVFFLLCLYALAITTNDPMRAELLKDLVKRTLRSVAAGA
ncbi:TetR/AcrR family transcriptional regulator [Mycolicibacterium diernhoferi]|uniref:TetR family transcriptional regulator n=1 Tax=Mycolicibacterium diernhoferi TaxID=1801 RepID=A0A1Q4HHQ0_9MYCO|nr:TetR/AcrR family transcriptional regulator [Mycolicibacterium diernhoferi]OJZ67027.1 TetR family transcriptional regulator [Mycolicibacterium diernhoferi]OPE56213.1 TetR family transcriptional regulator [Mycolicibacterium diernhoferi]PEG52531.1 TetR/AcrR family transcriptional regulator [Mycolicibacterium diernhoferi]QYL23222.1 TetR/AcrR family transcriptional regulator [Mycolicibacterium diernhoferi]